MTPATDLCGGCGEDVHVGTPSTAGAVQYTRYGEFQYDRDGTAWHVDCKPKGTDMAKDKQGIVTKLIPSKKGEIWAFNIDGEEDYKDPAYALKTRDGMLVPERGKYIKFTYDIEGDFNRVQEWSYAEEPEGAADKVAATVTASETAKNNSIHESVAVQVGQAVVRDYYIYVSSRPVGGSAVTFDQYLGALTKATHRIHTLLGDNALREPGEPPSGGTPKPVAENNPPRGDDGTITKASEAERASQDAQGAPPAEYPPDHPKHVATGAPV